MCKFSNDTTSEGVHEEAVQYQLYDDRDALCPEYEFEPTYYGQGPGTYTIDDYMALPDEKRVELIDGRFYEMNAPHTGHNVLADEIQSAFTRYIRKNRGKCLAITSPVDVQLDRDNKTMLQPDVALVCDRKKFVRGIIYGAPDLTVEVLSPSTRSKDLLLKLRKYRNAGVREYWVVDPQSRQITVHRFDGDADSCAVYRSTDRVPVGIFGGGCTVDFEEIFGYAEFLLDENA